MEGGGGGVCVVATPLLPPFELKEVSNYLRPFRLHLTLRDSNRDGCPRNVTRQIEGGGQRRTITVVPPPPRPPPPHCCLCPPPVEYFRLSLMKEVISLAVAGA